MAHTLGMSIQQHQQKSLLKFYVLPRAKTSRFPEKFSEKRLKKPWVKVQVHRICESPFWHLFVTLLKMGAKKPGSRSISLYRDTNCHSSARERISPLPLPVLSVLCRELNDFAQRREQLRLLLIRLHGAVHCADLPVNDADNLSHAIAFSMHSRG